MKKIFNKRTLLILILITLFGSIFYFSRKIELTKVVLKCVHQEKDKSETVEYVNYYKITKHLFNNEPYKLYSAYAYFNNDDYEPLIEGYWEKSKEVEHAWQDVKKKDTSKYFYPDWYTFIHLNRSKFGDYSQVEIYTFINRETLKLESSFFDLPVPIKQCEISDIKHFDDAYESDKQKKIKDKKI